MPHHAYPLALVQGLDNIGADGHSPDFLNLAPSNGLAVSDQCQCLQQRTGILLRSFVPKPGNPLAQRLAHLESKTAGDLLQLKPAPVTALGHFFQCFADRRILGTLVLLEQLRQLGHGHGPARGQQRALKNLNEACFRHTIPPSP